MFRRLKTDDRTSRKVTVCTLCSLTWPVVNQLITILYTDWLQIRKVSSDSHFFNMNWVCIMFMMSF